MNYKLIVKNISKKYNTKDSSLIAIEDVSFNLKKGEIIAIVGTSGCGKSTLLNIIDGLELPTSGTCEFDKENPTISYMLQNDALLPWRNVLDNACLGLELMHKKDNKSLEEVKKILNEYGLQEFTDKKPSSLSGGMKQRVALIRSLAIKPDILLLDEPFSALDYYTRTTISEDVLKIIKKTNTSTIIITHDIAEALSLADRIIVLSKRPSVVKKIYEINFCDEENILKKRSLKKFSELYESIWRDLDEKV